MADKLKPNLLFDIIIIVPIILSLLLILNTNDLLLCLPLIIFNSVTLEVMAHFSISHARTKYLDILY